MRMGVVADDLTGSNDIGSMFAKAGYTTDVYTFEPSRHLSIGWGAPDICILNTSSRLDPPALTYKKVSAAARALRSAGATQFFAKTSSAFVGPVGAQFDAMLDVLKQEFAVVVVGFPKNGRTTVDGIHYVRGKRLEDSEFRNDPTHPMTQSSLVDILQSQTRRRVGLVDHKIIARGAQALQACLSEMRATFNYVVLDVVDQDALKVIARAVHDAPILCGSSALAEELPAVWATTTPSFQNKGHESGRPGRTHVDVAVPSADGLGVLCVAGSLMPQTAEQIRYLREKGAAHFELNTLALFDSRSREAETDRLANSLTCRLQHGQHVIVHSPNSTSQILQTRALGASRGMSETEVARLVSEALAQVVVGTRRRSGFKRLIVAGGETSAAVCARLKVNAFRVYREIQPGLPSCLALGSTPLLFVLKSGSFGTPDFFEQAIEHMQGIAQ